MVLLSLRVTQWNYNSSEDARLQEVDGKNITRLVRLIKECGESPLCNPLLKLNIACPLSN